MSLKEKLRKNLMLSILLVIVSFKSFSQNVTSKDSTEIVLTRPIAKLVVKDLITGDQLLKEYNILENVLSETNLKLSTQKNLVINLNSQIDNYKTILGDKDKQFTTQKQLQDDLEKALKQANRRTTIYKIGTAVGAAATLLLLVQ